MGATFRLAFAAKTVIGQPLPMATKLPSPPRVGMVSLGCPKALVDSERILTKLRAEGYEMSGDYAGADVVLVNTCGFLDSAKEEMDDYENRFLQRGLATLAFDGPGQGEAEYDFAICPEYERPVKAVIDYLEKRQDVDAGRVGIWGVSLGGYYAPRAACFETRIKACVALSGAYERSASFEGRPVINVEAFRVRSKSATLEEAGRVSVRMSLKGIAKNITCPIYIVAGTRDRLTPHTHAEKLAAEVSGPCVLSVIEGGNHVVNNLWYRYRDQTADWLATQLGVAQR